MKKLPIKENPEIKYDYKALIKSNSELDKYFKNKLKKVSFKTSSNKEDNKEGKGISYFANGERRMGDYLNGKEIGMHVRLTSNWEVKIENF